MRAIDAYELKRSLAVSALIEDQKTLEQIIDEQPTIERKKGKWELCEEKAEESFWVGSRCSECNYWKPMGQWNFCPNCGADMRG